MFRSLGAALTLVCTSVATVGPVVTDGLIAYWPLDGSGTDESGNGHHGSLLGGPTPAAGRLGVAGSALFFDGVDDYLDVGNGAGLKVPLPVTISAWVKPSGSDVAIFNNDFGHDVYRGIFAHISNNRLAISFGDGGPPGPANRRTKASTTVFQVGQWYHVAMIVRGAADMDIYVNNTPDAGTYTGTGGPLLYSTNPGNIGRWDSSVFSPPWYAHGTLDELYFFGRELSPAEITRLFTQPVSIRTTAWAHVKALYR